ncbi:MAG: TlpA family protein disulfide reductase [Phycisphaeraceae bacterium]|nr:TlpA family protein disulfide reductase [Phycisphaeraceae bacterium]
MKSLLVASLAGLLMSAPMAHADPEEAKAKLERAAAAVDLMQTFSADVVLGASESLASILPSAEGKVVAKRVVEAGERVPPGMLPFSVRLSGTGRTAIGNPDVDYDVIMKGRLYYWLDHEAHEARQRLERLTRGSNQVRLAKETLVTEVFSAQGIKAWIETPGIDTEAPAEVDGVPCDVIRVPQVQANGQVSSARHTLVYLGAEDGIPRRVEMVVSASIMSGSVFKEFHNVTLEGDVEDSVFELARPPGYAPDPNPSPEQNVVRPGGEIIPPETAHTKIRNPAQPFDLVSSDGERFRLADLRGTVLVLDFFATWQYLHKQDKGVVQELEALQQRYRDMNMPVRVLAINFREKDPSAAVSYLRSRGATYPVLLNGEEMRRVYGIVQFPTYFVIGIAGEALDNFPGYEAGVTFDRIQNMIDAYLVEKGLMEAPESPEAGH